MTDSHWGALDTPLSESRTCTIGIRSWVVKKLGKTNHPAPTVSWCDLSEMLQVIIYLMVNTSWPWPRGALLLEDLFHGINIWSNWGGNKWRQGLFDLDPIRGKAIGWIPNRVGRAPWLILWFWKDVIEAGELWMRRLWQWHCAARIRKSFEQYLT